MESEKKSRTVAIIVAHPDDETLWAGGTILSHPSWKCYVICLCRKYDEDRAPKFYKVLNVLKSDGIMGDLDDGTEQTPLDEKVVEAAIIELLPSLNFDLIITHSQNGEYTKHLRHEEISKASLTLWQNGKLKASEFWTFAYEDGNKKYYPRAIEKAPGYRVLTKEIWSKKYSIMTDIYGFTKDSWEAETVPRAESFWQFTDPLEANNWLTQYQNEKRLKPGIL